MIRCLFPPQRDRHDSSSARAAARTEPASAGSTVTITLDEQTLLLPPGPTGGVIGPSITTDAIDIQLNHARFGNQTISGNFDIGQSTAGYSLIPPAHAAS
jgi:hypothetical protein